jgi:hypothetical protein
MMTKQISVISKQETISEQSGKFSPLSEKQVSRGNSAKRPAPAPSVTVEVGPQPTKYVGKYESFMQSQAEEGVTI